MQCTKVSRQIAGGTGDAELRHRQKVCTLPTCLSSLFSPKGRRELEISICACLTRTVFMRALAAYLRALCVAMSCIVANKHVGGKIAAHTVPTYDLAPSHCAAGRWLGAGEPGSEAHGRGPCHGGPGGAHQGAASASSQQCAPSTSTACLVQNGLNLIGSIGANFWLGRATLCRLPSTAWLASPGLSAAPGTMSQRPARPRTRCGPLLNLVCTVVRKVRSNKFICLSAPLVWKGCKSGHCVGPRPLETLLRKLSYEGRVSADRCGGNPPY